MQSELSERGKPPPRGGRQPQSRGLVRAPTAAPRSPMVGRWAAQRLGPSAQRSQAPGEAAPGGQGGALRRQPPRARVARAACRWACAGLRCGSPTARTPTPHAASRAVADRRASGRVAAPHRACSTHPRRGRSRPRWRLAVVPCCCQFWRKQGCRCRCRCRRGAAGGREERAARVAGRAQRRPQPGRVVPPTLRAHGGARASPGCNRVYAAVCRVCRGRGHMWRKLQPTHAARGCSTRRRGRRVGPQRRCRDGAERGATDGAKRVGIKGVQRGRRAPAVEDWPAAVRWVHTVHLLDPGPQHLPRARRQQRWREWARVGASGREGACGGAIRRESWLGFVFGVGASGSTTVSSRRGAAVSGNSARSSDTTSQP